MNEKNNDKKERKKKPGVLPTQMNLIIRTAAGGYLLYLAYGICNDAAGTEGGKRIILALSVLSFVVVGAICVFSSIRALNKGEYAGGAADTTGESVNVSDRERNAETGADAGSPDRENTEEPETREKAEKPVEEAKRISGKET